MHVEPPPPTIVQETIQRHWACRAATYDDEADHGLHSEAQCQAWLALLARWAGQNRSMYSTSAVGPGS